MCSLLYKTQLFAPKPAYYIVKSTTVVVLLLPAKYIILVHIEVCEFRNIIQTNVLLDKTHSCITVHQMLH